MRGVFNRMPTKHNELKNRLKFYHNNVKLINVTQKTINFQLIDAKGCSTASYEITVCTAFLYKSLDLKKGLLSFLLYMK